MILIYFFAIQKFWGSQMDPRLAQYITNFLFGSHENRSTIVEFHRFAELYVHCVRGTIDERICVLLSSLGQSEPEPEIAYPLIKEVCVFCLMSSFCQQNYCCLCLQYVEAVVSSYMRAIRLQAGAQFKSWESKGFRIVKECVQKLGESLAFDVVRQGNQKVTRSDAERWLQQNPTFLNMLEHVFLHLFNYRAVKNQQENNENNVRRKSIVTITNNATLLPFCEGECPIFFRNVIYILIIA